MSWLHGPKEFVELTKNLNNNWTWTNIDDEIVTVYRCSIKICEVQKNDFDLNCIFYFHKSPLISKDKTKGKV